MKKIIALLLVVLLLAGCGSSAVQNPTTTQAPGTQPAPTTEAPLPEGIRNVIIIIGDGMGDAQISLGEMASGEEAVYRNWTRIYSNTNSLGPDGVTASETTDSAAGATALATGQLTLNDRVGRSFDGKTDLKNIMEYAKEFGKVTGVVTTDSVSGATPAGFSAHADSREDTNDILVSQIASGIDLFCANKTSEAYSMKSNITKAGYTYISSAKQIGENMDADKLYCLLNMAGARPADKLNDLLPHILTYLDQDREGFVLMVEQAHIDKFCHQNDIESASLCADMLNDAVAATLQWAQGRDDTAIIVTADHETGGLSVSSDPIFEKMYASSHGQDIYYQFTSDDHTSTPVSVYLYGFSPDLSPYYLEGDETLIKNISVFSLVYSLLENPQQ